MSRKSTRARGYGRAHQLARAQWAPKVNTGRVACARCGELIVKGSMWHLDHNQERTGYLGPSHAVCNVRAPKKAVDPRPTPPKRW